MDLRLRPDPSSTPPAVPVPAALDYYESVGQNWERAAFIKARACAGDIPRGRGVPATSCSPSSGARNLDFAAIADIHSIKRQIHAHKVDERVSAKGVDLKLGRGGIREIEFYVQTQQLILGGRDPEPAPQPHARRPGGAGARPATCEPATARGAGRAPTARCAALEHRVQMLADEQTHRLPEVRRRAAAGRGARRATTTCARFDAAVTRHAEGRQRAATASSSPRRSRCRRGSAAWCSPASTTIRRPWRPWRGWGSPTRPRCPQTIRGWHHGRIPATRTERGPRAVHPPGAAAAGGRRRRPARRTRPSTASPTSSPACRRACSCSRCSWPSRSCSSWSSR